MVQRKNITPATAADEDQYGGMERDLGYLSEASPMSEEDAKTALTRVATMADQLRKAQKAVALAAENLSVHQANLTRIEEQEFPDLLREVGLTKIELKDGAKLSLEDDIRCGITEERKPRAFDWLRKHNFDGIIKSVVAVQFDKGQDKEKAKLFEQLMKKGLNVEAKDSVHPATLKSFLKEQRAKPVLDSDTEVQKESKQPPADFFGIFPISKVKLKEPKN